MLRSQGIPSLSIQVQSQDMHYRKRLSSCGINVLWPDTKNSQEFLGYHFMIKGIISLCKIKIKNKITNKQTNKLNSFSIVLSC